MGQVYYTIEKLDGGIYRAAIPADFGQDEEGGEEPQYATEAEAVAAINDVGKGGKGAKGKGAKEGDAPAPKGSFRVVQKLRLQSGIIGAPSSPGALDPPVVPQDSEAKKKARDERRKEEDAEYERTGYVRPEPLATRTREVSGSPLAISREDRITSTSDPGGGKLRNAASGGKPETPAPARK